MEEQKPKETPQSGAAPEVKSGNGQGSAPGILQKLLNQPAPGSEPSQKPQEPSKEASDSSAASNGNVFTKLFGIQSGANQSQRKEAPSISSLLGPKPLFSRRASEEVSRKTNKIAKAFFYFSIIAALGAYGFFYTQLQQDFTLGSSQLGPNIASRFEGSNAELRKNQTDLNLLRYRLARVMLDEINNGIDSYEQQKRILVSNTTTDIEKQKAKTELERVSGDMKTKLQEVQRIFSNPLGIDIFTVQPVTVEERESLYESLLINELTQQQNALGSTEKPNTEEIRLIGTVLRLVQNQAFRNSIRSRDIKNMSDDDFGKLLTSIREESVGELAAIERIRGKRINWGQLIADINSVTRKADLYYGQGLFKTVGGFLFSSYRFDAKSGLMSLSGVTKTSDSKTFSFISKLIDSIEKSPKFKDIDFRSFSKSRDESGDYAASINLDFALQTGPDPRDDTTSL